AIAATNDVSSTQRSDLVVDLVVEVVDGNAQVGKGRREHQAGTLGAGGFRLQQTGAATGIDGGAGAIAGVIGRNAQAAAVGTQLVIALLTPADAGVDVG